MRKIGIIGLLALGTSAPVSAQAPTPTPAIDWDFTPSSRIERKATDWEGELIMGLPRMRRMDELYYELKAIRGLTETGKQVKLAALDSLDPNAINSTQLDILRTGVELSAKYSEQERFTQARAKEDVTLKRDLLERRRQRQDERLVVSRKIAEIDRQIADLPADSSQKTPLDAKRKSLVDERDAIDKDIEALTGDIDKLTATPADTSASDITGSVAGVPSDDAVAKFIESLNSDAAKSSLTSAALAASAKLDNHYRLWHEIVAKHTGMRDDEIARQGELFVAELRASISPTGRAKGELVRTQWDASAYAFELSPWLASVLKAMNEETKQPDVAKRESAQFLRVNPDEFGKRSKRSQSGQGSNGAPPWASVSKGLGEQRAALRDHLKDLANSGGLASQPPSLIPPEVDAELTDRVARSIERLEANWEEMKTTAAARVSRRAGGPTDAGEAAGTWVQKIALQSLDVPDVARDCLAAAATQSKAPPDDLNCIYGTWRRVGEAMPHPYLLIPDQSTLNIKQTNARVRRFNMMGILSTLIGFGLKTRYERQHESYGTQIDQSVYAAAFGAGTSTFGWDHSPLPGSQLLIAGERRTYAFLSIPHEAQALLLVASGNWYPRKHAPPGVNGMTRRATFVLPVSFDSSWRVDAITTATVVPPTKKCLMVLEGRGFAQDIDVFVGDKPLVEVDRLSKYADPMGSGTRSADVPAGAAGWLERVSDSELRLLVDGTAAGAPLPRITLHAPGGSVVLNDLDVARVNDMVQKFKGDLTLGLFSSRRHVGLFEGNVEGSTQVRFTSLNGEKVTFEISRPRVTDPDVFVEMPAATGRFVEIKTKLVGAALATDGEVTVTGEVLELRVCHHNTTGPDIEGPTETFRLPRAPVIDDKSIAMTAGDARTVSIQGAHLLNATKASVAGLDAPITSRSEQALTLAIPALPEGRHLLVLTTDAKVGDQPVSSAPVPVVAVAKLRAVPAGAARTAR